MGAKPSSNNGRAENGSSDSSRTVENGAAVAAEVGHSRVVTLEPRIRTRSLNNVGRVLTIPGHSSSFRESDLSSSPEDTLPVRRSGLQVAHSFPSHLFTSSFLHGTVFFRFIKSRTTIRFGFIEAYYCAFSESFMTKCLPRHFCRHSRNGQILFHSSSNSETSRFRIYERRR